MEKAIHITTLDSLRYYNSGYARIYFGVEFCQRLIPSVRSLEEALRFTRTKGLQFTLVTPFVTEEGLNRLGGIFKFLKKELKDCEIVVNDWGVLEVISRRYKTFKPLLGRLLTRQNRNPAMAYILKKQYPLVGIKGKGGTIRIITHVPPDRRYQKGIKASYVNACSVQNFLSKFNIKRVELNNVIQGLNLENLGLKVSLYTPFVNISTTRFCPMESRTQKILRINTCRRECQKYYERLKYKALPKYIYKRGNTIFYKNPVDIKAADESLIDRIVFEPELPF